MAIPVSSFRNFEGDIIELDIPNFSEELKLIPSGDKKFAPIYDGYKSIGVLYFYHNSMYAIDLSAYLIGSRKMTCGSITFKTGAKIDSFNDGLDCLPIYIKVLDDPSYSGTATYRFKCSQESQDIGIDIMQNELITLRRITKGFGEMFYSGSLSDFTLVVDKTEIKTHKLVLASSSPYFKTLFASQMIESKEKRLEIEDFKLGVVQALVGFLYTGSIKRNKSQTDEPLLDADKDVTLLSDLAVAADKYQMDNLKYNCEQLLCKLITKNCADDLLVLAIHLKLGMLRIYAAKCIAGELLPTEGYIKNI